jgi:solute carrier family 13 (sodium-dependent dicarboxylate transporter), member 2/3/5
MNAPVTGTTISQERLSALLEMDRMTLSSASRPAQSTQECWMRYLGFPAGIVAFLVLYFAPFGPTLSGAAQSGIACFTLALTWWVTEPFPTYVTSLALMFLLLVTGASNAKAIMDVLGLEVIWLNLLAFVLSSMLVKTRLARRAALWLVVRFGASAQWALFAFLLLQLFLAPLIPATAARCVMTLPLMLVVAGIYGSTEEAPNAFGKNLMLLNLVGISILSSMSMTGSSANLIAVGLIETMGGRKLYYFDWMRVGAPIAISTAVAMWYLGPRLLCRIPPGERAPVVAGGMDVVRDKPWAEAESPWHLLIFSAGAYAGGLALDDTGAAEWAVRGLFGGFNLKALPFGAAYTIVVAVMMYSHLLTTSKTVRTMIMIPIIITLARSLGWDPVSFALPAALCIDWVVGLPISGKPNVILFSTNQYSVMENLRYGVTTCTIGLVLLVASAATWFHWIGLTPSFWALPQ